MFGWGYDGMKAVLQELASKGAIYGLGASFNSLVGFLLIPFFTKQLTATEYGRYAIAEMVLNLSLALLGLGMNVAILARYPSIPSEHRDRFFGSILSFMLLWTLFFEMLFLALAWLFGHGVVPVLNMRVFTLITAISALETVWLLFATLYRAQGAAWQYIGASTLQAGVGLVATVWLITRMGYRDEGILEGRLLGDILLFGAVLLPQFRRYRLSTRLGPWRDLLRIGLPLIPATFSSMWVLMSPRYFIQWYGTVADVGVFAMSSRIAGITQLLYVQPFAMAWMVSLFTIFKRTDARQIYARVLTYYILLGVTIALMLGLVAEAVIPLLAHQRFPLSPSIVLIVALAQVASGLMYPLNIGPYVLEQTGKQIPVFIASGALITIVGIVLVQWRGPVGGALALLAVYIAQALLLAIVSQKLYPIRVEWTRLVQVVCALTTAFFFTRLLGQGASHSLLALLLPPLFVGALVLTLIVLRFPDSAELSSLRRATAWLAGGRTTSDPRV